MKEAHTRRRSDPPRDAAAQRGPPHGAPPGAVPLGGDRCRFVVHAPSVRRVEVRLLTPRERLIPLEAGERGYHAGVADRVPPGTLYLLRLDEERDRPDPASRHQPEGVHGPSRVVDPRAFPRTDQAWTGLPLADYVLYELHVGTFTPEGTFDAVIPHLRRLRDLGVTAVELMPVAQFPGTRNWGYDGVFPYAAQESYGGPEGLSRLVDACHREGMAAVLDVVYNHLGPEGNRLREFGPYFTDRHRTPWGEAVNYDGPGSDEVRRFFIGNALYWLGELRFDALRLDAIHGIADLSASPFLAELAAAAKELAARSGREIFLIAESDLNDARVVTPPERGGLGLDAQWNDDFHHALHVLLTGEQAGYYADFGGLTPLATAYEEGFVYSGRHSRYRGRRHGNSSREVPAERLVVFAQNHDQVGNRMRGERISALVSFESLKLAAGTAILSPYLPLLFMGEEYGETAPFLYFVSHSDRELIEAVRRGRRDEFAAFGWEGEPPDPQDEGSFLRSKLDHGLGEKGRHAALHAYYRELLRLRKAHPALARPEREGLEVAAFEPEELLCVRRRSGPARAVLLLHFGDRPLAFDLPLAAGDWRALLDSSDARWGGPGSAASGTTSSGGRARVAMSPRSVALLSNVEKGGP